MFKAVLFFVVLVFGASASPAYSQSASENLPLNLRLFGSDLQGVPFNVRMDANITTVTTSKDIQMAGTIRGTFKDALGSLNYVVSAFSRPDPCASTKEDKPFTIRSVKPEIISAGTGIDSAKITIEGFVTHCKKVGLERWSIFSNRSDLVGDILIGIHVSKDGIVLRARKPSFKLVGGVGYLAQNFTDSIQADVDKKSAAYVKTIDGKKLTTPWINQHFRPVLRILSLDISGSDLKVAVQISGQIQRDSVAKWTGFKGSKKKPSGGGEVRVRPAAGNAVASRN